MKKKIAAAATAIAVAVGLGACTTDADMASYNLSQEAEDFKVQRRIVATNGFTDAYIFSIEGRCSWEREENLFQATCKHGPDEYRRHDFFLGDNATIVSEQLEAIDVSTYRTKVIFKPESIIPSVDVKTSLTDDE